MPARPYKNRPLFSSGYTLIEILVSLSIIAILFTFGYSSYRDFGRRQALAGVAGQVQGDLRLAQQMAITGQKPTDGSCGTLDGIRFGIYTGTQYRLRAQCNGAAGFIFKDVTLPGDFTIATRGPVPPNPATPNPIIFNVLGRGTNIVSGSGYIDITQTSTGRVATITIDYGGNIH